MEHNEKSPNFIAAYPHVTNIGGTLKSNLVMDLKKNKNNPTQHYYKERNYDARRRNQ